MAGLDTRCGERSWSGALQRSPIFNRLYRGRKYAVALGNLCDQQQWVPALEAHVELFGPSTSIGCC